MISQSAVTLYIYRVGWTYPARNPFYRSRSIKILIVFGFPVDRSDRSDPPVRLVGVAEPATRLGLVSSRDWSDWSPVRIGEVR